MCTIAKNEEKKLILEPVLLIVFVGRRAYGPFDGKWLPTLMNVNNARGTAKSLSTIYILPTILVGLGNILGPRR